MQIGRAKDKDNETDERETVVLFWGGPMSQWFPFGDPNPSPSSFTIDGIAYSCAEQWMMAEKARLFGDAECLAKILASDSPRGMKEHGRRVRGFDVDKWNGAAREIVYRGNLAKFSQNDSLREHLMATGDKPIGESSPEDLVWGIGFHMDDPRSDNPAQWTGTNWLGEALMRVRSELQRAA